MVAKLIKQELNKLLRVLLYAGVICLLFAAVGRILVAAHAGVI